MTAQATVPSLGQAYKKNLTEASKSIYWAVPVDEMFIEPGFNIRTIDQDHVDSIYQAMIADQPILPLAIKFIEPGRCQIIDGHHRYLAALKYQKEKGEAVKLNCFEFKGDEADQVNYMITSSQTRNLTPMERARGYERLFNLGVPVKEIAAKTGRAVTDVRNHLDLLKLPAKVRIEIEEGRISYIAALELYRSEGENTVEVLEEAERIAQEKGKDKVTGKDITEAKKRTRTEEQQEIEGEEFYREEGSSTATSAPPREELPADSDKQPEEKKSFFTKQDAIDLLKAIYSAYNSADEPQYIVSTAGGEDLLYVRTGEEAKRVQALLAKLDTDHADLFN